jgi:Rab GDP dissociation inhibitor
MEESYDFIVCGTGLSECILSGLLSTHGYKVLHLDRNSYYGGDSASLNLTQLWQKFNRPAEEIPKPATYGNNRDWNIDLIPKFVMSAGLLVKILLSTKVTRYLEWRSVDSVFVYQYQAPSFFSSEKFIHKVPSNDSEALKSPLMGLLEKNRCRQFFQFVHALDVDKKETHAPFDLEKHTMAQFFEYFGLQQNTIDFIGHAVSLHTNDKYLNQPAIHTLQKIKLYLYSITKFGKTPFVYPLYGLGGLPEGFSRLCAVYGGVYMLNRPVDEFLFDEVTGKVTGILSQGEKAYCKQVICDPSYIKQFTNSAASPQVSVEGTAGSPIQQVGSKLKTVGKVIRSINILSHPIPNTEDSQSCQIIIPQSQLNRNNDIYVMMVSSTHRVAFKDKYICIVSTTVETNEPIREIQPALNLLGPIDYQFNQITDLIEVDGTTNDQNIFVTKSYDATSHFESVANDVFTMFERITGKKLELKEEDLNEEDEE